MATPLQLTTSMPRYTAIEAVRRADGHVASRGAHSSRPAQVPAMIIESTSRTEKSTSAMARVTTQGRDSGGARIRSAKPVGISEAGSVANVMANASNAMMKPVSKYTAQTMPLNDMMLAREGQIGR